ncbi:acyltransferase family protein [Ramlibacter sp. MMS24-I3-19]|uniref:acyltransferase family protein n=1 Tax=Ramlibacter sp. MMS24-I3-19 TaxID=3416606 RepID=UPI003CFF1187
MSAVSWAWNFSLFSPDSWLAPLRGGSSSRHRAGSNWARPFLIRRWLRTLPNYYLFLAINALLVVYAVAPGRLTDLLPFTVFVQNLAWHHPPFFGEAWSLAVEEVFYLLLPLVLTLLGRLIPSKGATLLTATFLLVLAPISLRFLVVTSADPAWDEGVRKIVAFRLDALMLGVLTGWLCHEHRLRERFAGAPLLVAAAALLLPAVCFFLFAGNEIDRSNFARVWLFPVVSVGFALFIVSGLKWNNAPQWFKAPAGNIARWSYAIYLAHMPVFHSINWCFGRASEGDVVGAVARWLGFLVLSFAVAALIERFFERPILAWRDHICPADSVRPMSLRKFAAPPATSI